MAQGDSIVHMQNGSSTYSYTLPSGASSKVDTFDNPRGNCYAEIYNGSTGIRFAGSSGESHSKNLMRKFNDSYTLKIVHSYNRRSVVTGVQIK